MLRPSGSEIRSKDGSGTSSGPRTKGVPTNNQRGRG